MGISARKIYNIYKELITLEIMVLVYILVFK